MNATRYTPAPVIRAYTLPVYAFDLLKAHQRRLEAERGVRVNNSEALTDLLEAHTLLRALTIGNPNWDFEEAFESTCEGRPELRAALEMACAEREARVAQAAGAREH